ncbi:MAG: hypothetical protein H0U73_12105 [Tatlockia sp.]|nr:hypothetical protein [Tatlockia sp.]
MIQNYEFYKAVFYAKKEFQQNTLHIALVGDNHNFNHQSLLSPNEGIHHGVVEIVDGFYIMVQDDWRNEYKLDEGCPSRIN